jgi:hypothetical protein
LGTPNFIVFRGEVDDTDQAAGVVILVIILSQNERNPSKTSLSRTGNILA